MKDKILDILTQYADKERFAMAIEQLMCNGVVSTYIDAMWELDSSCVDADIINKFKNKYPEQTIKTAIENYKKEIE